MGGVLSSAGSSSNSASNRVRVLEILKKTPFMQMLDDKTLAEVADCFQLVRYAKGAIIKNDPWLFFVVAEGAVDISSLIPTKNSKQHLHEVLCQRNVGDYISFAAREQVLSRLMDEMQDGHPRGLRRGTAIGDRRVGGGGAKGAPTTSRKIARKDLIAMLDLNRITADAFAGCTLLKLQRDRFLKLRGRLTSHRSEGPASTINHTRRFSDDEDKGASPNRRLQRRNTMTRPEKIQLINTIIESDIVNYLFDIPFLDGVEQSRLVTLSNLCSYMFIRKGETLCREGEIGDKFFICIRGTLQASVQSAGIIYHHSAPTSTTKMAAPTGTTERKIQSLKRMGAGAYFGEISLLFKIPRICSIAALEDALLVYVDRVAFCNFLKIVPEATLVLLEHVRLNFLDTLIKQGCDFLNAIPQMKLQELSYVSEILEFAADATVIAKGERHTSFYLLVRGQVRVEYFPHHRKQGDHKTTDDSAQVNEVVNIRAGGYFGHEAILLGTASSIQATAMDQCLVLKLTPELFFEFFDSMPALYAEFCIKCLREKCRPEHVMQHYDAHKLWAADCVSRRKQNEVTLFESIEDFTWEAEIAEDRMHELALMVYLKFLADNAPMRVAVRRELVEKIEDSLSSQDVDTTMFKAVRVEILKSMEDDHFDKFKHSALFQEFLTALHCPQTIYDDLTAMQIQRLDMDTAARTGQPLELEDLDENEPATSTMTTTNNKSIGRRGSYKRYLVGADSGDSSDARSTTPTPHARRKTRTDVQSFHRRTSSSFVF